jgi:hypothetical protein
MVDQMLDVFVRHFRATWRQVKAGASNTKLRALGQASPREASNSPGVAGTAPLNARVSGTTNRSIVGSDWTFDNLGLLSEEVRHMLLYIVCG